MLNYIELYITHLSRYFVPVFMVMYAAESFMVFRHRDEASRHGIYTRQIILMFLIHFSCFMSICLKIGKPEYFLFYAFQQILMFAVIVLVQMIYPGANRLIVNNMCMLLSIGFVIITRISFQKAVKQFFIVVVSMAVSLAVPYMIRRFKGLRSLTWIYAIVGTGALAAVMILGSVTNGSKISYSVAGITFQPSEFIKIIFVFFAASALYKAADLFEIFLSAAVAAAHVIILVMSKDLGSALIFFIVYFCVLFVATNRAYYLIAGAVIGCGGAYVAYNMFAHVRVRVQAWSDPWSVINNAGYQISKSLFAISSGGAFGLGLFEGTPKSIPFVTDDFIFSAIAEELGLIFAAALIAVCISTFVMFIYIAAGTADDFYRLVVTGLAVTYVFQVFLTVGGGTKFIPMTGVTLPLVSYGGSSVLSTLLMFFIAEGVSIPDEQADADGYGYSDDTGTPRYSLKKDHSLIFMICEFTVLMSVMTVYACVYANVHRESMLSNSYNSHQAILARQNSRGSIYSSSGEILADTELDSNGKEVRKYPYASLFAHAVGYASNGRSGLEAAANYYLINSHATMSDKITNEAKGYKYPGDSVYSTFDIDLQKTASDSLGVYKGAVIVTEPSTGRILAMVSKPDFDPNTVADEWDSLTADTDSSVLLNRTTQGLYPPGSTFKIMTALEYIRENPDSYNNYSFDCTGHFTHGDDRISCYHGSVHGKVSFADSFAKSCNCSFANIGLKLNRNSFGNTLSELLFNKNLPLDYNYSKSRIDMNSSISDSDMMQAAIGQGRTQMTPVHLNMITDVIANKGILMKPYAIDRVVTSEGTKVKEMQPEEYGQLMTEDESAKLTSLMEKVVEEGTGKKLRDAGYTAAGKTGSAEYDNVKGDSHAWFTGFAPAQNPEICVTVIIEGAGSGGDYAVPIAKRIFDRYFEEKTEASTDASE